MASGGTWQTQNKIRPGAYINVVGVPKPLSQVGERGTVAVAMPLKWGDKIIELTSQEFLSGEGLIKAGVQYTDSNYTPTVSAATVECAPGFVLRLILQNASKVIIYRTNTLNASTAYKEFEDICQISAKFNGSFGNRISASIERQGTTGAYIYTLKTFIDGAPSGITKSSTLNDLVGDALVDIDWEDGAVWSDTLSTPTSLTGGDDSDSLDPTWLSDAISEFYSRSWDVFVCETTSASDQSQIKSAIEDLRDNNGVKVQAILYNAALSTADYEGIVNVAQQTSYVLSSGDVVRPSQVVFYVAGITAGASLTVSNSGAVVTDAVDLLGTDYPKTNEEISAALNEGKFVLSRRADGEIVVEKDINSLHTLTPKRGYIFTKQRPIRVLDTACNDIKLLWCKSYLGKVSNDSAGRDVFKGDVIAYLNILQNIGAIQNFDPDVDVAISAGDDVDSVVVALWIQPVDSMEKLYLTINVVG